MTLSEKARAVDAAIKESKLEYFSGIREDSKAYYFSFCGENGEPLYIDAICRVEKQTLKSTLIFPDNPLYFEKRRETEVPEERKEHFRELKIFDDEYMRA